MRERTKKGLGLLAIWPGLCVYPEIFHIPSGSLEAVHLLHSRPQEDGKASGKSSAI